MSERRKTVGVLSLHNSRETKALLNTIEALGHKPVWMRRENISAVTEGDGVSVEPDVDVVINRLLLSKYIKPVEDLGLLHVFQQDAEVLNSPDAVLNALHKFAAQSVLEENGVPTPHSILGLGSRQLEDRIESVTEENDSAVHKYPISTHGDGTTKVALDDWVPQTHRQTQGILQELIENKGETHTDTRVYVVDGKAIGAMRRYAPDGDWRTNVSRGGNVEDVSDTLDNRAYDMAVKSAEALGLDCAGVDLVESTDGWLVLEANPTAGFKGFFSATGVNPAPVIAQTAIERVGGKVESVDVTKLMDSLDASIPSCRPDIDLPPVPSQNTIGYTERVQVCGSKGSSEVVAKADTGSSQTCVGVDVAEEIGAGPIQGQKRVKGSDPSTPTKQPIVSIGIRIDDYTHDVDVIVKDRDHLKHPVLLGRDVLDHYSVNTRCRVD